MKTTKKARLVFSLLCLGIFSGCENEVETGRYIQHRGDGGVSKTTFYENAANGDHISRTTNYDNQEGFQLDEAGRWIWEIADAILFEPSN